jgi:mRNA interferase RelE/StbE
MRVHHGHADVLVTEQFVDGPDVVTGFKEVRGERMPECVAPSMLDHTDPADGLLDGSLKNRLVNMMLAFFAGLGALPSMFLGKDTLPAVRSLYPDLKQLIKSTIRAIAANPECGEPLQRELDELRKYRVRRFCLIYSVDQQKRIIRLMAVCHRQSVCEELTEQVQRRTRAE